MRPGSLATPAELFDAAIDPGRHAELAQLGLEVLAAPGSAVPSRAGPGCFAVRRGLGEARLAVVAAVERIVEHRASLEGAGIACDGQGDGVFALVDVGPGERPSALQLAGPARLMRRDTVLLGPRHVMRRAAMPRRHRRPPAIPHPGEATIAAPAPGEAAPEPITAPRPALAIGGSVGRGAQNAAADVRAVQDRLVELRALAPADAAAERPQAAGTVAEAALATTIAAIEALQRRQAGVPDGKVEVRGVTRTDLDRAIPQPTAGDLEAVAAQRSALAHTVRRGLTLSGPVGAVASGNVPADVRAVQARLVELGRLSRAHREDPAAGSSEPVPQARLSLTISALRALQGEVPFWVSRGAVAGAVTEGVAAPGDATAALLARVAVHEVTVGTATLRFRDHVVSRVTRSEAGVAFVGTASPSALALADYLAAGLEPGRRGRDQAVALQLVSAQEGNFDAINTYDRAQVSVGFIQFAGGRGLPPYLALLKARQPDKFRDLLQKYGIEVEFTAPRGVIQAARVAVLDPRAAGVLRGAAAEAALRDDKRLTAVLIVSGRDRDVQKTQVEAAVRGYVIPALGSIVSWAAGARAALGQILRSQKGMAALFDRAIQEGVTAARGRFERLLQRMARRHAGDGRPATLADLQAREGDLLADLERDLQAAADVAALLARARRGLADVSAAARAAGASRPALLAHAELAEARRAVGQARARLAEVVNVAPRSGGAVDDTLAGMAAELAAEAQRLTLPAPGSAADVAAAAAASRAALATTAGPVATAPLFLARVQRIRASSLDASRAEPA